MECLPDNVLEIVFSFLDAEDLARVAAVCHIWNAVAGSPSLWRNLCRLHFGHTRPCSLPRVAPASDGSFRDPARTTYLIDNASNFREAFAVWSRVAPREESHEFIHLLARARAAWAALAAPPGERPRDKPLNAILKSIHCEVCPAARAFLVAHPGEAALGEYNVYGHHVRLRVVRLPECVQVRPRCRRLPL
jgi:hypothetical protein